MSVPTIAVLGTCRVYDSVHLLHEARRVELIAPFWGFPHSAAEILQIVDMAQGRTAMPETQDYWLINTPHLPPRRWYRPRRPGRGLARADVVVIELSSLKAYTAKGYYSQINRMAKVFAIPEERLEKLLLGGGEFTQTEADLLQEVEGHRLSEPQSEAALLAAIDALAPRRIILANHFVVDREGAHFALAVRKDIRALCDRVAAARPDRVVRFDPSPDLHAMDYPITDYAHYEDRFKRVVADRLAALLDLAPH